MAMALDIRVLVISVDESPSPALARVAIRSGWPLLSVPRAFQAIREIRHRQPGVVIVQVTLRLGEGLELVQLLPDETARASLIAIASSHHESIERAVRAAGASCYLPTPADAALVERTVAEMLDRRTARSSAMRRAPRADLERRITLPPPVSLDRTSGGGLSPPAAPRRGRDERKTGS